MLHPRRGRLTPPEPIGRKHPWTLPGFPSRTPDGVFGARSGMKRHVDALVREALSDAIEGGLLRTSGVPRFTVDAPRHAAFGDLACDVALVLGRQLGRSPHAIGATIASQLRDPHGWLAEVGVGGPGFVNFRFAPPFWHAALADALEAGGAYGRSEAALGRRVRVE